MPPTPPQCIRKAITDAYYEGRNAGYSMEWAADKATRDVRDALIAKGTIYWDSTPHAPGRHRTLVLELGREPAASTGEDT